MTSRPFPLPPQDGTIHLIGDVQTALPSLFATSMRQGRRDKLALDFRYGQLPAPAGGHLTVGDLIHRGQAAEDADAKDLFSQLTANTGKPVHKVMGNHDIYNNARTPAQWAASWGLASPSYTVDLPWVRLIILGIEPLRPGSDGVTIDQGKCYLSTTTVAWLDAQLRATTKDCWIVCHAPLQNTITGTATDGWLRSDGDLTAVLAANANAKAWISGHTHTPLSAPDVFVTTTVNGRKMAHINAGAVANDVLPTDADTIDWTYEYHVPMRTFWVTYVDSGRYELRCRDHGSGSWVPRDEPSTGSRIDVITL